MSRLRGTWVSIVALLLAVSPAALAHLPGKNGNRTVTAANTVLNQYAVLAANAAVGDFSITVANIADLNSPEPVGGGPRLFVISCGTQQSQ